MVSTGFRPMNNRRSGISGERSAHSGSATSSPQPTRNTCRPRQSPVVFGGRHFAPVAERERSDFINREASQEELTPFQLGATYPLPRVLELRTEEPL
jgi:hypothetical protein